LGLPGGHANCGLVVAVIDIQIMRTWGRRWGRTGSLYKLLSLWNYGGKTTHYLLENRPLSSWKT